jgi:hypothetical protein
MVDPSAPLCHRCGGVWTNPAAVHCRFCGWNAGSYVEPYRSRVPYDPGGGETSLFWLRVAVIAIAISLSVLGACVSALAG